VRVRSWCWLRLWGQVGEWVLGRETSVVNGKKLCWRRNLGSGKQDGVKEVEHLRAVNGVVPGNKDKHVTGSNDFFLVSSALFFRGPQAHDFVRSHEGTLDLVHMRAHVIEDRRHARAGKVERRFSNGLRPRHFAEEFGGVVLVGSKCDANLAIADDALVASVFVYDLSNVLGNEVGLEAKPGHVGKRVRENLHAFEGGKLVNQEEQTVFVAELLGALKIEFFGEAVNDHRKDEAHERAKPDLVAWGDDEVERHGPFVIYEVLNRKVARGSGAADKWIAVER